MTTPDGPRCQRCAGVDCADEQFRIENSDGIADVMTLPETDVRWDHVLGTAGGTLNDTLGDAALAEYRLEGHQRAYLFDDDLLGSAGPGTRTLILPLSGPTPVSLPLDEPDVWQYARVYDIGACSYTLDWQVLANQLAMQVLAGLAGDQTHIENPRHLGTSIEPFLSGTPAQPAITRFGLERPLDWIRVTTNFEGEGPSPCGTITVQATVSVRLVPTIGFNIVSETEARDDDVARVRCEHHSSEEWYCWLPDGTGSIPSETMPESWWLDPGRGIDEWEMDSVKCDIARDQYFCRVPYGYPDVLGFSVFAMPRPVDYVAHSVDLDLEVLASDAEIDGCSLLGELAESTVADQIRREIGGFDLGAALAVIAGDSAIDDFGISPSDVPACPDGTDAECQVSSFMGNRRHGCVDRPMEGLVCDRFRLEARRLQFRHDGLEIVLAENDTDPQKALLAGIAGPLPGDPLLCLSTRDEPPAIGSPPEDLEIGSGASSSLLIGRLCGDTEADCHSICPSIRARCGDGSALVVGAVRPGEEPAVGSACFSGECCLSELACDGHCVDMETDPANCGSCGNVCDLGYRCVSGACVLP